MPPPNHAAVETFRGRGSHEVLIQHVEQRDRGNPTDLSDRPRRQHQRRQHQPRVPTEAGHRKRLDAPVSHRGNDRQLEQQGHEETGQRDANQGQQQRRDGDRRTAPAHADQPQNDSQYRCQNERRRQQAQTVDQHGRHHFGHRYRQSPPSNRRRFPQVPLQKLPQVANGGRGAILDRGVKPGAARHLQPEEAEIDDGQHDQQRTH